MAHPLVWPGEYYLYAIGNTSAICLTRDIPPEETANILLLGCGDQRNILYTIFSESQNTLRKLDFTCCDIEPAILARNALLFSMLADNQAGSNAIWNIFFHIYIDNESYDLLIEQCRKLVGFSETLQQWNSSPYGRFMTLSTAYTLTEIRRHWSLYIGMADISSNRMKSIRNAFHKQYKPTQDDEGSTYISMVRSLGPLLVKAMITEPMDSRYHKFWQTGVTFSNPKEITAAKHINPTFVYSLAGEGCNVHYETDPLVPFHLAALLGNAQHSIKATDLVNAAKAEFGDWCSAFQNAVSPNSSAAPTIRFFLGDALAACRVLGIYSKTAVLKSNVPVAQWRTQVIELNEEEYRNCGAPAVFDVIDTSNLVDYIGLLNILIATVPLLPSPSRSGVLYTESLLFLGQNATKEFTEHLHADITTISLLLGICPVDYLSGFTSRSNTHELLLHEYGNNETTQFHQVTTWKSTTSGDAVIFRSGRSPLPTFDPYQLGTLLYDIYHDIYKREDSSHFRKYQKKDLLKAISGSNMLHDIREGFVMLLKLIRERLEISGDSWEAVMERFVDLNEVDQSMPMNSVNYQDMCAHLHRHGVYTFQFYSLRLPHVGRFRSWDTIPPVVRIILIVPRENLSAIEDSLNNIGTPLLQCDIRGARCHNIFTAVHVAFGQVIQTGTNRNPRVAFREDTEGGRGTSPLVASFTVPSHLLANIEPPENLNIGLMVRSTPGTAVLIQKLGMYLTIFSAKFMDESLVHVLPEPTLPKGTIGRSSPSASPTTARLSSRIGDVGAVAVDMDQECELVTALTSKLSLDNDDAKKQFSAGAMPLVKQVSPCVMRVSIGSLHQDVPFPFPIIGSQNKLRLARKSSYIEVVVPVSGPFKPGGMTINRFPVVSARDAPNSWSIHRLNLTKLPVLNTKQKTEALYEWLNPHVGSMLSSRERSLRKKHKPDPLMFVKETIHAVFVRSSGIQGGKPARVICLQDKATNNCDTVLFISELRYDLHSHTMVCDGYVLPLTQDLLMKLEEPFGNLFLGGIENTFLYEGEVQEWKRLLPAFAERCRTSWSHSGQCEYAVEGSIPRSELMEADPLCSCGRGKDTEGMLKVDLWRPFSPYVTRIAMSPLFAVTYLETVLRDPSTHRCSVCRGKGKPKIMTCSGCQKVRYCSRECQKKNWNAHKKSCKA